VQIAVAIDFFEGEFGGVFDQMPLDEEGVHAVGIDEDVAF
jgi:hypothetical protein